MRATFAGSFAFACALPVLAGQLVSQSESQQPAGIEAVARNVGARAMGVPLQTVRVEGVEGPLALPELGVEVFVVSILDQVRNEKSVVVLTADGTPLPFGVRELFAAERELAVGRRGKASRRVMDELRNQPIGAQVDVAIWLTAPDLDALRIAHTAGVGADAMREPDALGTAHIEAIRGTIGERTAAFAARARALGIEILRADDLAPIVFARASLAQLAALHADPAVEAIDWAGDEYQPRLDVADREVRANDVRAWGYNGSGATVAIVEGGSVCTTNPFLTVAATRIAGAVSSHTTGVASCVGSTHPSRPGIAPGARILSANGAGNLTNTTAAVSWSTANGAQVLNLSYGAADPGSTLTTFDKYLDYVARSTGRTFVIACGNSGLLAGYAGDPGAGYNQLAVGNFDDRGNSAWAGEVMASSSSWRNPTTGQETPQVAAPGTNIAMLSCAFPWTGYTASGTSFSAPITAGSCALMVSRAASLGSWQEAQRAIHQATAWHNIEGSAVVSSMDGCGGIDVRAAYRVVARGQGLYGGYNLGVLTSGSFDSSANFESQRVYMSAGQVARACLAWDSKPGGAPNYDPDRLEADLDLYVYSPTGALIAASASALRSFETVQFTAATAGYYSVRVRRYSFAGVSEFFATAVSRDTDI